MNSKENNNIVIKERLFVKKFGIIILFMPFAFCACLFRPIIAWEQ